MVESETGTGKTLAFLIPILQSHIPQSKGCQALIVSPTRELSSQTQRVLASLAKELRPGLRSVLLIGGASPLRQIKELQTRPQVTIGTPGRIMEMAREGKLDLRALALIVLDEADRLVSKEMRAETDELMAALPPGAIIQCFSATLPEASLKVLHTYAPAAEIIRAGSQEVLSCDIEHWCLLTERRRKLDLAIKLDRALKPERAILFTRDSGSALNALARLEAQGVPARALHGDFESSKRLQALEALRRGACRWLITSDVAARGLDIEGVTLVLMLDPPADARAYVHRAGRTGRMGRKGLSIALADGRELRDYSRIAVKLSIVFKAKRLYAGEVVDQDLDEFFAEGQRMIRPRHPRRDGYAGH
jgi:superfamily II DNA/RNA helicase